MKVITVFSITFKVTYTDDYDEDELSLPESDGFADETTAVDTEAATFGDESFVEESETAPEADGFTAESVVSQKSWRKH